MRDRSNITIAIRYEVSCLPTNGATANVVHHDLDLHFQGDKSWNVYILETVTASNKYSSMTFIEVNIWHRMGPLPMLNSMTLTRISRSQIWNVNISEMWESYRKNASYDLQRVIFAIKWHLCECCTPWHWFSFSRSNILLCICYKKLHRWWMSPADLP